MVNLGSFLLPRLEPLVEFDSAAMWFPTSPEVPGARSMGVGIIMLTHLPQVELEVAFKWMQTVYRVSAHGLRRVMGPR